jgi:hypothetical protein
MKSFRGVGRSAPVALALLTTLACSEDAKEEGFLDAARIDARVQDAIVSEGDSGGGGAGGGGGPTETHTRLSMLKQVKPDDGTADTLDLVIYDLDDDREANLTQSANGEVDCKTRCAINRQMTWIAWYQRGAASGNELWVAPIDTVHYEVKIAEKRKIADTVQQFEFTNDGKRDLVVFMQGEALGPEGQFDVRVEPVAGYDAAACEAGGDLEDLSACPQYAGAVNVNGGFRVTPFGALIILLRTDLSSMTVSFFNVANGASQALKTFGTMDGTGSQFDARLPVALSPDATYLAVFTKDEFLWKMFNLKAVPNPPEPVRLELWESEGDRAGDCTRPMPFLFNIVQFDPRFDEGGGAHLLHGQGRLLEAELPGLEPRRLRHPARRQEPRSGDGRPGAQELAGQRLVQPPADRLRPVEGRQAARLHGAAPVRQPERVGLDDRHRHVEAFPRVPLRQGRRAPGRGRRKHPL